MPNLWRRFADLLPTDPTLLATVVTLHTDGTVSVELLGGGFLRVRGGSIECAEGDRVFVRAGVIEGVAPALPQVMIEI